MHQHEQNDGPLDMPLVAATEGEPQPMKWGGVGSVYIQLKGAFTGTYRIEGSIDGGTTWWDITTLFVDAASGAFLATPISAPLLALLYTPRPPPLVRLFCVTYSAGTPTAHYSYRSPS